MHVVLALDGSKESQAATELLAHLPWREKPQVSVVSALVDSPYDLVPTDTGVWLREAEREDAVAHFESAKKTLQAACVSIEHIVDRKHPRTLILETAKQHDADLIVMGSKGHSAPYRLVVGSTADYVANHAKCSVLIARAAEDTSRDTPPPFRLLVACDGSEESNEAYHQMGEFCWPAEETHLHLAMMLEKPKLLPEDVAYDPEQIKESEKILADLLAPRAICDDVKQSVRETPHIGSALTHLAEVEKSNLVFVGGTGKSAVARFFLGSTSRYMLHHSECSIWIARSKQWN